MPLSGRLRVNVSPQTRIVPALYFSIHLKICFLFRSTPSIWLLTSSCRSCSMAFEFCFFSKLFFWVNTCWVLTASWQNTFLKSCCNDDRPPDGNRRGAQRPGRGVMYVFCSSSFHSLSYDACVCLRACLPGSYRLRAAGGSVGQSKMLQTDSVTVADSPTYRHIFFFYFFFRTHCLKITHPPHAQQRSRLAYWYYRPVRFAEAMQKQCN